jgi:hypothetical protein
LAGFEVLDRRAESFWSIIAYLSNTERVFQPPIRMITPSATPALRRLRGPPFS